ncbi:MAG: DUF1704 domain-containing protein [Planctomycetes bacterium]|nr:DUF1704 domain-containing protein [Planctomycetota bacterium]
MVSDDYSLCHHAVDVDHALRDIGRQVLLIQALHPRNTAEERERFFKRHALASPVFVYRELSYDPRELRARLRSVARRAGRIRSPWLRSVFRAKCRELALKLALVAARGTAEFLPYSMRLFPPPTRRMAHDAEVLACLPRHEEEKRLSAAQVEKVLRATIRDYRRQHRSFACRVKWVDSSLAEASISDAQLNVRKDAGYSERFLLMLQHHEIGVHLVTAQNGDRQPLNIFRGGLAGYDPTQEGLALFAEFRAGAITTNRLRVLGARVLAADLLCRGASFAEVYAALTAGLSLSADEAFSTCLRCFRGGGYTKDVIYQPGFLGVFNYWVQGGDLAILFVGKFPLSQVRHVKEALRQGLVKAPLFVPPMILDEGRLHAERTVFSLLRGRKRRRLTGFRELAREEARAEEQERDGALQAAPAS